MPFEVSDGVVRVASDERTIADMLGDRSAAMAEHCSSDYEKSGRIKATVRRLERIGHP
uniref:Uncharacterized protein n=1 Tax=uncultured bacterium BLR9 TaxID=506525 RepID=C0INC3_9BACT|nr:hypothetical protein AKSOIL_0164 [uncultured bacterium BLR9]